MSETMRTAGQAAGLANPTEARAGAHVVGIPEGGRFAHPTARSAEGSRPPEDQQAPQGRGGVGGEQRAHTATARVLHLDDREFMHVVSCIEHDRNRMRKAIKKGLAVEADMRTSNSLWDKLQVIRAQRQFGRRA